MSWIRDMPPDQIKADALEMARRKQRDGCLPCAQAYVDLARRHGASEAEVQRVLRPHPSVPDAGPG